jgi:hypothetical protein
LGQAHALLLACLHRRTHVHNPYYADGVAYFSADRLIWGYDIHLIANLLSLPLWREVVRMATDKGLGAVCLGGIQWARRLFRTSYPEFVAAALTELSGDERPALYLSSGKLRQQWMDFISLEALPTKVKFLRELAFPPAAYMRSKYPRSKPNWLPWLYTRRGMAGLAKSFGLHQQAS